MRRGPASGVSAADRRLFSDGIPDKFLVFPSPELPAGPGQHQHRTLHRQLRRGSRSGRRDDSGADRPAAAVLGLLHPDEPDPGVSEVGAVSVFADLRDPAGIAVRVRRVRDGGVREFVGEQRGVSDGGLLVLDHSVRYRRYLSGHVDGHTQTQGKFLRGRQKGDGRRMLCLLLTKGIDNGYCMKCENVKVKLWQ
mmetsp:Transcript_19405/g.44207  ORF Transcript_19405/g.44207 Transcript_19405/m.44207 type:complete len:194 (+) Transcript_19405:600-1181(+)